MTSRTERRVREIRRRTRQYRKRHERRVLSTLSVCSLLLFAGIGILFAEGTVRWRPHRGRQLWLCAAARRRKRIHCCRHRRLCGGGDSDHDLHPAEKQIKRPYSQYGRKGGLNEIEKTDIEPAALRRNALFPLLSIRVGRGEWAGGRRYSRHKRPVRTPPEHNADCGYTEGIEGTPCNHEHTAGLLYPCDRVRS